MRLWHAMVRAGRRLHARLVRRRLMRVLARLRRLSVRCQSRRLRRGHFDMHRYAR